MRITDRYIAKQILVGTLYAIVVLSVVLMMGKLFKDIRPYLVENHAPAGLLFRIVVNVLPYSLMFTIPWGFLSAVLLVFGRLSGDNEITGMRVAGMSIGRLAIPVFVIAGLLSGVCLWVNMNVVPHSKASLTEMVYEYVKRDPRSLLEPGIVQSKFKNQKVFVESRKGDSLEGFHLYRVSDGKDGRAVRADAYVHAGNVSLVVDDEKKQLRLKLIDAFIETKPESGTGEIVFAKEAEPWLFDFGSQRKKKTEADTMSNDEILRFIDANPGMETARKVEFRSEITRRYTFSLACLSFACVGVPLGLKSRRKDSSVGLLLSLGIGMAYFLVTVMADGFESDVLARAILWAPNVFCVVLGIVLFRRARFR